MCLLIGTGFQVSDVAHGPLVFMMKKCYKLIFLGCCHWIGEEEEDWRCSDWRGRAGTNQEQEEGLQKECTGVYCHQLT